MAVSSIAALRSFPVAGDNSQHRLGSPGRYLQRPGATARLCPIHSLCSCCSNGFW